MVSAEALIAAARAFDVSLLDEDRRAAHDILCKWVTSRDCFDASLEILASDLPVSPRFFASLCVRDFIRWYPSIAPDFCATLCSLFIPQLQTSVEPLPADLESIRVSLADLCLRCPPVLGDCLSAFSLPLQLQFLVKFFEESNESFWKTDRTLLSEVTGHAITVLSQLPVSERWVTLYGAAFLHRERPGEFIAFLPVIGSLPSDPLAVSAFLDLLQSSLLFENSGDADMDLYLDRIIHMAIELDPSFPQAAAAWKLIFDYSHEWFFAPARLDFAHAVAQRFMDAIGHLLTGSQAQEAFEAFATFVTKQPDFLGYGFAFISFVIAVSNEGGATLADFRVTVWVAVYTIVTHSPSATADFFHRCPLTSGLFFPAAAVDFGADPDFSVWLIEQFFELKRINGEIGLRFLESVCTQPCAEDFVPAIFAAASDEFPDSAQLLRLLGIAHPTALLEFYIEVLSLVAPHITTQPFPSQVPLILVLWNLNAAMNASETDLTTLTVMDRLVQHACGAAVRTGTVRAVCHFLDSLRRLIQQAPRRAPFLLDYFQGLFAHAVHPLMRICEQELAGAMCDTFEQALLQGWIADVAVVVAWFDSIVQQLTPDPSYFRLLAALPLPPSPVVCAFITRLAPDDNDELLAELFCYLAIWAERHGQTLWASIERAFVLSFLFAPSGAVTGAVLDFLRATLAAETPAGLLETAVGDIFAAFVSWERCVQSSACRLLIDLARSGMGGEIEAALAEAWPGESADTAAPAVLRHALASHIRSINPHG
jgi:hypothetical protein